MAPKRKAEAGSATERAAKKPASSGVGTPQSIGSSDDFSDDPASETEVEEYSNAVKAFSAKASTEQIKAKLASDYGVQPALSDASHLNLKPDHLNRPLWIDSKRARIILESFNPLAKVAQDFLTSIAEPLSRPSYLHEYAVTIHRWVLISTP